MKAFEIKDVAIWTVKVIGVPTGAEACDDEVTPDDWHYVGTHGTLDE